MYMNSNSKLSFEARLFIDESTRNEFKEAYGKDEEEYAYINAKVYANKSGSDKDTAKFIYRKPDKNDPNEKDAKGVLSILAFKNHQPVFISKVCSKTESLIDSMKSLILKAFIDPKISEKMDEMAKEINEKLNEELEKLKAKNDILFLYSKMKDIRAEQVEHLIEHGAEPNARDSYGNTPLHIVEKAEVAEVLLKHNADPSLKNKRGKTPLDIAKRHKKEEVIEVLQKYLDKEKHFI